MTESMIERVSKAIRRRRIDIIGHTPAPMDMIELEPYDLALASAAMEAMREPTEAMCREGARAGGVRSTWLLMITAALSESK